MSRVDNMTEYVKEIMKQYKEPILYLVFGGLAFIVSVSSYVICEQYIGINELIANVISWVLAVLFAYFTNRTWVFESRVSGIGERVKEMISFFGGRVFTLAVEELIIFIFNTNMGYNSTGVKIVAQVVVILLNYVISKLFVFKD